MYGISGMTPPTKNSSAARPGAGTRLTFEPTPLTLGAVQLGLPYGVANATGIPSGEEASAILDAAMAGGIEVIDTAPGLRCLRGTDRHLAGSPRH